MMSTRSVPSIVASLDIGTTKVTAFIGRAIGANRAELLGLGKAHLTGLKRGNIVDMGATSRAIELAAREAQRMAEWEIESVFANIAGTHIAAHNSEGSVAITSGVVGDEEIRGAMEVAKAVPMEAGRMSLHAIPQEYRIDLQGGIRDPHGMAGNRLEMRLHVVTCETNAIDNLHRCIENAGLSCAGVALAPLASAAALLGRDEKELGVCLVDMGGGTTDIIVYLDGAIQFSRILPMAGDSVTKDIAVALRTPVQNAEELKVNYACALQELVQESEVVQVPGVGRRSASQLSRFVLAEVVGSRYRELLKKIQQEISESGIELSNLASGVVLTGGAANLEGIVDLAEEVFHVPVALGFPSRIKGLENIVQSPSYSTGVGLLEYGLLEGKAAPQEEGILGGGWRGGLRRLASRWRLLQG